MKRKQFQIRRQQHIQRWCDMISNSKVVLHFSPGTMYVCFNEVHDEDCLMFENIAATKVIINLLKISRIFSKFISGIIPMYKKGIKVILVVKKDSFVETMFHRWGIDEVLTMYNSIDEALKEVIV